MEIDKLLGESSTKPLTPPKQIFSIEQIREELQKALQSGSDFNGDFYFAERQTTAPNPCIYLDGPGLIGLPLNERDARAIIDHAALAPFGRKDQTIVDTSVRNTWEINPSKIRFDNPAWQKFVDETVVKRVCTGLGVPEPCTGVQCELYKMLLYETGSHFLPHQDTEKAKGMFATVIIVLPSSYTGGQLHLQHDGRTEIVDMSSDSNISTAVFAWYTDVMHEVKPITSGYRLALSYNLFQTASIVVPQIPGSTSLSPLRTVLKTWSESAPPSGEPNLIVKLLKHEYTESNLQSGIQSFKGEDAHLMGQLKPILDEFGFSAFLCQITYHISGPSASGPWDDDYYGYGKRGRYDDYYHDEEGDEDEENEDEEDEDDEGPKATPSSSQSSDGLSGFIEVYSRELQIENLFELDGRAVEICDDPIEIEDINLIPKDPFDKVYPDDVEDEGYTGNEGGTREHWYRRTALLIIPESSADDIMFCSAGFDFALSRLDRTNPSFPTVRERKTIDGIMNYLVGRSSEAAKMMADFAVEWNDLDMWRKVVKESFDSFEALGAERLVQAWKTFGFCNVQPSFESLMILSHKSLKDRMETLQALVANASPEEAEALKGWSATQEDKILCYFQKPCVDDIPLLITAGKRRGAAFLCDTILPQLVGKTTAPFEFMLEFIKAVYTNADDIAKSESSYHSDMVSAREKLHTMLGQCLDQAWGAWDKVIAPSDNKGHYYVEAASRSPATVNMRIDRLISVVDLCLTVNHASRCEKLQTLLSAGQGDKQTQFRVLYTPFCKKLIPVLHRHNLKITSHPFDVFFRSLAQRYLQDLLPLPKASRGFTPRKFACRCEDCKAMNTFLSDHTAAEKLFRMAQGRRTHVENFLRGFHEVVSFTTVRTGNPHGINVTKTPDFHAGQKRQAHIEDARLFLRNLGGDRDIQELLGNGIADLRFILPQSAAAGQAANTRTTSLNKETAPVAGQKRKKAATQAETRPPKNLGVIDLTMSD